MKENELLFLINKLYIKTINKFAPGSKRLRKYVEFDQGGENIVYVKITYTNNNILLRLELLIVVLAHLITNSNINIKSEATIYGNSYSDINYELSVKLSVEKIDDIIKHINEVYDNIDSMDMETFNLIYKIAKGEF